MRNEVQVLPVVVVRNDAAMRTIRYGEQRKARFVESSQLIHLNSFGCPKSFMFVVRRFRLRALEPAVKCRLVGQRPSSLATRAKGGVVVRYLSSSPPESETPLSGEIDDSVGDNEESGEALSKKDLAKILSQQHGITASMANNILTTVFGTMTEVSRKKFSRCFVVAALSCSAWLTYFNFAFCLPFCLTHQ